MCTFSVHSALTFWKMCNMYYTLHWPILQYHYTFSQNIGFWVRRSFAQYCKNVSVYEFPHCTLKTQGRTPPGQSSFLT